MASTENLQHSPAVGLRRLTELRALEACERGLAEAYAALSEREQSGTFLRAHAERHYDTAALLAARIVTLGGLPDEQSQDTWIIGAPDDVATLQLAELNARRTYHDHLIDLDPETMTLIRDHILPAHEHALAALAGVAV